MLGFVWFEMNISINFHDIAPAVFETARSDERYGSVDSRCSSLVKPNFLFCVANELHTQIHSFSVLPSL